MRQTWIVNVVSQQLLKPRTATLDSCFDLVGFLQHSGAESEAIDCLTDRPANAQ